MLALIVSHGHLVGVIKENVCGLKRWVGKQSAGNEVLLALGFVFELGHAAEFSKAGVALEKPAHLGMFWHMALNKEG